MNAVLGCVPSDRGISPVLMQQLARMSGRISRMSIDSTSRFSAWSHGRLPHISALMDVANQVQKFCHVHRIAEAALLRALNSVVIVDDPGPQAKRFGQGPDIQDHHSPFQVVENRSVARKVLTQVDLRPPQIAAADM